MLHLFVILLSTKFFVFVLFPNSNVESADEIMSKIMDDEGKSELVLQKILALKKDYFAIPTFHNFAPPTEYHDLLLDWPNGLKLSSEKFYSQVIICN